MNDESLLIEPESLPENWLVKKLGGLVQPSKIRSDPGEDADSPYLALEHIESGSGRILGKGTGSESISTKTTFKAGDILFPKLRPYLNKTCRAPFDGVGTTEFYVFPQSPAFDSGFLCHFLRQPAVVSFANHHANGVQLPRTNFKVLAEIDIPLPEPKIQRVIADLLDKVSDRQQDATEKLDRARAILRKFRRSILAAACDGSLTERWRSANPCVESVGAVLTIMETERKKRWQAKSYKQALSINKDEELEELPTTWCWTTFDQCADDITVGHVGPMRSRYTTSGTPFLRSQNVRPLRFSPEGLVFIPPDFERELDKSRLIGGELLVTRSGANTGQCCVYPLAAGKANCSDLVITKLLPGLNPEYAAIYVNSPQGQSRLLNRQVGMAQPHFNVGSMKEKALPFPPTIEQAEIVRRVSDLLSIVGQIEIKLSSTARKVDATFQSALTAAFRGELNLVTGISQ